MLQRSWMGALVAGFLAGCVPHAVEPEVPEVRPPSMTERATSRGFREALSDFAQHDERGDWDADSCRSVAEAFKSLGREGQRDQRGEAFYDAALAHQRCQEHELAREMFEAALKAEPSLHRARAQLVLYSYEDSGDREAAIAQLGRVIRDAKFQNVEALVSLAALQIERGVARNHEGDLESARENLQRALAIDDRFMPALNQLALLQLTRARMRAGAANADQALMLAGAQRLQLSQHQLDLAALIASQGLRKNPRYAPLHNTAGLVQVELRDYNAALKSFKRARELDSGFFAAHMNYGSVNLGIRGFVEAEKAYRTALKLDSKNYEAHLGLALALRGQIGPGGDDKRLAKAEEHLARARRLAPHRPEAYYNAAILAQEFRAKGGDDKQSIKELEAAYCLYGDFVQRAPEGRSEAKRRASNRRQDIEDMLRFITNDTKRKVRCG